MILSTVICNRLKSHIDLTRDQKTRLSTSCTKQCENPANLVMSCEINTTLACLIVPIWKNVDMSLNFAKSYQLYYSDKSSNNEARLQPLKNIYGIN